MTKTIFLISFLISSLFSFSQSLPTNVGTLYDTAFIQKYSSNKFKLNNKKLKRKELRDLLLSKAESAEAYKIFKKNNTVASVFWTVSVAAYVSGLVLLGNNPEVATGLVAGGLLASIATIPPGLKADRSLHQAVWLYNRAVLTSQQR